MTNTAWVVVALVVWFVPTIAILAWRRCNFRKRPHLERFNASSRWTKVPTSARATEVVVLGTGPDRPCEPPPSDA